MPKWLDEFHLHRCSVIRHPATVLSGQVIGQLSGISAAQPIREGRQAPCWWSQTQVALPPMAWLKHLQAIAGSPVYGILGAPRSGNNFSFQQWSASQLTDLPWGGEYKNASSRLQALSGQCNFLVTLD